MIYRVTNLYVLVWAVLLAMGLRHRRLEDACLAGAQMFWGLVLVDSELTKRG